jgi:hypothetical protein
MIAPSVGPHGPTFPISRVSYDVEPFRDSYCAVPSLKEGHSGSREDSLRGAAAASVESPFAGPAPF